MTTAQEFIADAYRDGGIFHESVDEITAADYQRGLRFFNYALINANNSGLLITYKTVLNTTLTPGTEKINVDFVSIDDIFYQLGTVRMTPSSMDIVHYFSTATVVGATGPPSQYYAERKPDFTMDIYFFFSPDANYPISIHGKKAFMTIPTLSTVLPADFMPYRVFFTFLTAVMLRNGMRLKPSPELNNNLKKAIEALKDSKQINTTINASFVGVSYGQMMGQAYLGGTDGWRRP
jgi:hypothetical protein